MNTPRHPGTITFVDGGTQKVTHTLKAADAPEAARFVSTSRGLVPVVKVVAFTSETQRTIREYGPDGTELRSTVQVLTQ
jgi:hypothetical protein